MSETLLIESADGGVSVPVEKRALGEFISGLLGQPQAVKRTFNSPFSIDHNWLVHLCALIMQRINQQNAPEPLTFEARVYFKDGVERTLTTLAAFNHFAETQPIISIGVEIVLAFLIHFPGKSVPERQELILGFYTDERKPDLFEILTNRQVPTGLIAVEIQHTERTWADDLMRLISDELSAVRLRESRLKKTIGRAFIPFSFFSVPIILIGSIQVEVWKQREASVALKAKTVAVLAQKNLDLVSLHEKINLLLGREIARDVARYGGQSFLIWALSIMAVIFFGGVLVTRQTPSFVVMSKAAEKYREETLRKLQRKYWVLLGSMVGSVILGIVGNFIYDYIK